MPSVYDCGVMVLSDRTIREEIAAGRIGIDPFDDALVQPCSRRRHGWATRSACSATPATRTSTSSVPMEDLTELVTVAGEEAFILHPGEFVLGVVLERDRLPDDIVATLDGKSSLGRLGLVVHQTAGVVDAGFDGHITLELANVANLPITVYPGMRIAQLSFMTLTTPADGPYGSGRAGQQVPGAGRAHSQPLPPQLRTRGHEGPGDRRVRLRRHPSWPTGCERRRPRGGAASRATTGGDVTDAESVVKAVAGVEAIAHLVAILDGSDEQFQAVNVGGTRNVVDAARAAACQAVPAHECAGSGRRARAADALLAAPSGRRKRP